MCWERPSDSAKRLFGPVLRRGQTSSSVSADGGSLEETEPEGEGFPTGLSWLHWCKPQPRRAACPSPPSLPPAPHRIAPVKAEMHPHAFPFRSEPLFVPSSFLGSPGGTQTVRSQYLKLLKKAFSSPKRSTRTRKKPGLFGSVAWLSGEMPQRSLGVRGTGFTSSCRFHRHGCAPRSAAVWSILLPDLAHTFFLGNRY